MLRRLDTPAAKIAALAEWTAHRDLFTPAEQAALEFADRMTRDAHSVDDATWAALRRHFDYGEVVEIAAAVGLFNYFNRFNEALHMEP
ncbi:MAG TPA: carboxymuconolactone decarboxylase family protein, partial [Chloroflexia bacterium]|nr:carboxymuconolactone decarboxylase family protein [Chloroflexia bacterium]